MKIALNSFSTSLLVAILATGCSSSPTEPSGELDVSVNVTGDPTTGPSFFSIALNGNFWRYVAPNQFVGRSVSPGSYELSLPPWSSYYNPSWCAQIGTDRQSVSVMDGGVQRVTFAVNCPPLVGAGLIMLTVRATGTAIPIEFPVIITRLTHGPKYSRTINVPANGSVESGVPVGVHEIAVVPGPTCRLTNSFYFVLYGLTKVVLRDGSTERLTLSVTCG